VAEIDDANAATTARRNAEEKRIVGTNVIWDQILLRKETAGFYELNIVISSSFLHNHF
jgi:hypothetical protein